MIKNIKELNEHRIFKSRGIELNNATPMEHITEHLVNLIGELEERLEAIESFTERELKIMAELKARPPAITKR